MRFNVEDEVVLMRYDYELLGIRDDIVGRRGTIFRICPSDNFPKLDVCVWIKGKYYWVPFETLSHAE